MAVCTLSKIEQQTKATEDAAKASQDSVDAAKRTTESYVQAERAWIFGDLRWFDEYPKNYSNGSSYTKGEDIVYITHARIKLVCKNDGRSPAWIDSIRARMEIAESKVELANDGKFQSYGILPPTGVGIEKFTSLDLECPGAMNDPKSVLFIWVLIEYHDAFGTPGTTSLGYGIDYHGLLFRQDGMPERNWNK